MKLKATSIFLGFCLLLSCGLAAGQSYSVEHTYLDPGYDKSGVPIPANQWTPIGPVIDIVCGGSGTCTIQAAQSIQVLGTTEAGNEVQVDYMLDGNLEPLAEALGEVPTDGSFAIFSTTQYPLSGVALGKHTVQTAVWSLYGTSVYNFNTTYQVLKPKS